MRADLKQTVAAMLRERERRLSKLFLYCVFVKTQTVASLVFCQDDSGLEGRHRCPWSE